MNRLVLILLGCQILFGCKKELKDSVSIKKEFSQVDAVTLLKNHLIQKSTNKSTNDRFSPKRLFEKLDFENIKVVKGKSNNVILAYFKKSTNTQSRVNSNSQLDSVVIFGQNADSISNYFIVNYTGDSITESNAANFYSLNGINESGSYRYYNSGSRFMSTLDFENGKLKSVGVFRKKVNQSYVLRTESCIDWYIVTTFYDSGGNITAQYETYIGTTCNGSYTPTDPYLESLECPGGGGGGGNGGGNENPPGDPNAPGDKLCSGSFNFQSGAQNSFWQTNLTGMRFENGQSINQFNAYVNLSNQISNAGMNFTYPNSATGMSALQFIQSVPTLNNLIQQGHITSYFINQDKFWNFDHHAAQVISSYVANFAALTVLMEIPNAADPNNFIARNLWQDRANALLRAIVPESKINFTQYGQANQTSIATYGPNCN